MHLALESVARQQLEARRRQLSAHVAVGASALAALLAEVDSALERLDGGTWGECRRCDGRVEAERLRADPLATVCLDCLSPAERRALEYDLELAAQVQTALLPSRSHRAGGWELRYHYEPLRVVSGDYCDLIRPEDSDDLYFVFGDVSGKGLSASLLVSHLHALFRTLAAAGPAPHELLERANRLFCAGTLARSFATVVAGRLTPPGRLELANAGHVLPLLCGCEGAQELGRTGLPLGVTADAKYVSESFQLRSGDFLFLYTDGLSEASDPAGCEYGAARLREVLDRLPRRSAEGVLRAGLADLEAFCAGTPRADDLTIMVVRRGEDAVVETSRDETRTERGEDGSGNRRQRVDYSPISH